jgi:hypothetical protein
MREGMTRHLVPRRNIVLSLITALLPSPLAAAVAPRQDPVADLLPHAPAARMIGERYLATAPEERSASRLAAALFGSMPPKTRADAGALSRLRQAVDARRRHDFACGDTVILDGWLLARTEARLCALAALT